MMVLFWHLCSLCHQILTCLALVPPSSPSLMNTRRACVNLNPSSNILFPPGSTLTTCSHAYKLNMLYVQICVEVGDVRHEAKVRQGCAVHFFFLLSFISSWRDVRPAQGEGLHRAEVQTSQWQLELSACASPQYKRRFFNEVCLQLQCISKWLTTHLCTFIGYRIACSKLLSCFQSSVGYLLLRQRWTMDHFKIYGLNLIFPSKFTLRHCR